MAEKESTRRFPKLHAGLTWIVEGNPLPLIATVLLFVNLWYSRPGTDSEQDWQHITVFWLLAVILAYLHQKLKKHAESLADISKTVNEVTELKQEIDRVRSEMELSRRISEQLRYSVKQKGALLELIDESVREDQLFVLAGISPASYLRKLQKAVNGAKRYITIQRYGPTWFKENAGANLLLRAQADERLDTHRIFVGTSDPSSEEPQGSPDAATTQLNLKKRQTAQDIRLQLGNRDDEATQWYWSEIGGTTHTYVADEGRLARLCGVYPSDIYDVVIVDDLVFEYREHNETLRFTTLSPQIQDGSALMKICSMLEAFGENPLTEVCHPVPRLEGVRRPGESTPATRPLAEDVQDGQNI